MLFGGYEPNPVARWVDGVPWDHAGSTLPADHERFAQLMEGAARRFPFLDDAGVVTLVCHPDAMTPDGNPLLGPMPGVPGFWMAAGLSLNGFGGAGGIGKTIAEWITAGATEWDVHGYRGWRFGSAYAPPRHARGGRSRDVPLLLPAALPARHRRVGPARPALAGARAHAGSRRRVRHEERLGAARLLPARAALAARRRRPAWIRLHAAARARAPRGRAHRVPRAGRHHRHDLVRQDRGRGARRRRAARPRVREPGRPAAPGASSTRSGATAAAGSSPT